jgi:NHLM bacteriocin system ABC transporter ATP-binding protein
MSVDAAALAANNRRDLAEAWSGIRQALEPAGSAATATRVDEALAVVRRLGPELGADVIVPADLREAGDPLRALLRRSGLRTREVELPADWPTATAAPMIGFAEDGHPVALVPRGARYRLFDPRSGQTVTVSRGIAATVAPRALALHPRLPRTVHAVAGLLRFALTGARRDAGAVFTAGLAAAALGLAVPVSIGLVVPKLLTSGARGQLAWVAAGVAVATGTVALLLLLRNAAVVRLQGRLQAVLEPAVWDRLLALEPRFFSRFSTGDLVQRANGIAQARQSLSDVAIGALLGAFFSTSSLLVIVAIDWRLGLLTIGGVAVLVVVLLALARRQQRHESEVFRLHGEVYGLVYPLLLGIDKIQTAGREVQAFALWAKLFGRQKAADAETLRYQSAATAVVAGAQPLLLAVLLGGITFLDLHVSVGHLIVAGVAVGQVVLALGQLSQVAASGYAVAPILERLQPILTAPPEGSATARDPGRLGGAVELDEVTFAYPGSSAPAVADVSLRAEPGELVALVGPSGAGKSTVVRLLLGFEEPQAGRVRYDGRDLADLDVKLVRRQLGVVLQQSRLVRGSLLDNILASAPDAGEEEAWRAAELAGVAEDLRRLPLGLQTRVGEDNQTFSGGQLQRLLIARALVRRPPIVLFDEATSALDNTTQQEVSDRIAGLECTRIVIAHRLSTIRRADRIYVIDGGRVVASGTYDELTERDGLFARLVSRQEL